MDQQRIYCDTTFTPKDERKGYHHHGFSEPYQEEVSVEDYLKRYKQAAISMNNAKDAVVERIRITTHDDEGNFIYDEKGYQILETIYQNT